MPPPSSSLISSVFPCMVPSGRVPCFPVWSPPRTSPTAAASPAVVLPPGHRRLHAPVQEAPVPRHMVLQPPHEPSSSPSLPRTSATHRFLHPARAVFLRDALFQRRVFTARLIGKLEARQGTKQSSRPCKLGPSDVFTGMVAAVSQGMLFQGESDCHMMV